MAAPPDAGAAPPLQPHHGGLWKRQDGLQQQLQPLREVRPAALQPEGEHPGGQDRGLYLFTPVWF